MRIWRSFLAIATVVVGCATGSTETDDSGDGGRSSANGSGGSGGATSTGGSGNTGGMTTTSGPEGGSGNTGNTGNTGGTGGSGGMTTSSTTTTSSTSNTTVTTATVTATTTTTGGCMPVDVVNDGGYESGPGGGWNETSTNFGTPICDVASCGTGGGSGPASGVFWAWFGGFTGGTEIATTSQVVTIPNGGMALLEFDLEIPVCDTFFDYFEVHMDGNPVFYEDGSSFLCGSIGYSHQIVDVSAYANGGNHTLELYGYTEAFFFGPTNFMVDNVQLNACL